MKTLNESEIQAVSGGLNFTNFSMTPMQVFGARVITSIPYIRPASTAFSFGYSIGNQLNKYTPIQSWISRTYGY